MNWKKEYSEEFDKLRKNRVEVSYYKYGSAADNFGSDLHLVDAIKSHDKCLEKYKNTGNIEYLLDAANYLMFEYMYPQHPKDYNYSLLLRYFLYCHHRRQNARYMYHYLLLV